MKAKEKLLTIIVAIMLPLGIIFTLFDMTLMRSYFAFVTGNELIFFTLGILMLLLSILIMINLMRGEKK